MIPRIVVSSRRTGGIMKPPRRRRSTTFYPLIRKMPPPMTGGGWSGEGHLLSPRIGRTYPGPAIEVEGTAKIKNIWTFDLN